MTKMLGNAIQAPLREKKLKTSALNVVNKHSVIDVEIGYTLTNTTQLSSSAPKLRKFEKKLLCSAYRKFERVVITSDACLLYALQYNAG